MELTQHKSKIAAIIVILIIVISILTFGYLWPSSKWKDENTILLYGFSVKGEVFDQKIIPAFHDYWEDQTGRDLKFQTTYAGSGKITQQVIFGAPAEVMVLSTEWDALQLKKEGLITTDWRDFPYNGTLTKTPWVILTRNGNPKGIKDFSDLASGDIELIHADPLTSGGACWSIFAIYGSVLLRTELTEGKANTTAAKKLLNEIIENVISWQSSARKALSHFALGYGDALITYENEGLLANAQGEDFEIVYPKCTIFSEHKIVKIDKNIFEKENEVIDKFIEFLYEPEIQKHFAEYHFRSVYDEINKDFEEFKEILSPFKVDYLGGWEKAHKELIDGVFKEIKG